MRLIDADALKEKISGEWFVEPNATIFKYVFNEIDNAPTVETTKVEHKAYNEGFKDGVDQGIKLSERPLGKWITNCGADMRGE